MVAIDGGVIPKVVLVIATSIHDTWSRCKMLSRRMRVETLDNGERANFNTTQMPSLIV
jgi:hypothetical protein